MSALDDLYKSYEEHAARFSETISVITVKRVHSFKSVKLPPLKAEHNIGLIIMSLFSAFVDNSIRLTNDKSTLFDKTWTTGVLPYFQNCGKVVQNLKKLKDSIDFHASNEKNWFAVFSPAMQRDVNRFYDEIIDIDTKGPHQLAVVEFYNFITVILERI